jgi:hypothetical protein
MLFKPGSFGKSRGLSWNVFLRRAALEKVGHFRKMPGFFFKRLKLDQLKKTGHFPVMPGFSDKARLFRLKLRTQTDKKPYSALDSKIHTKKSVKTRKLHEYNIVERKNEGRKPEKLPCRV